MKTALTLLALACFTPFGAAQNDIYIGVSSSGKELNKIKIAMPDFSAERAGNGEDAALAREMKEIIRADLLFSRYFDVLENGPALNAAKPEKTLPLWGKTGAQYLLHAKTASVDKIWTLSAAVYDIGTKDAVAQKYYKGSADSIRRAAHLFADQVVWRLTGKPGIAHTRIAFANDSTGHKEIYVVDYDGSNLTQLTKDRSIALLPCWSPDGEKLYYTTYRYKNPDMFEINLRERRIKPVSVYQGLNLAGGVSPDGGKIALTLSKGKDPKIYIMDIASKETKQITGAYGVDSSATYSPDGKFVAFVSDRSGNPQVHIIELETGKTRRLTRLNWCDSPQWSPSGEWITFAGRADRRDPMDIYLVDITGSQLRRLTNGEGANEDPSWSPDGRFIAFTSTRNGMRQIYVMDSDGSAAHLAAKLPGKSYTPSWSP